MQDEISRPMCMSTWPVVELIHHQIQLPAQLRDTAAGGAGLRGVFGGLPGQGADGCHIFGDFLGNAVLLLGSAGDLHDHFIDEIDRLGGLLQ